LKAEYVNPFVAATGQTLREVLGISVRRGEPDALAELTTHEQVNIAIGITGDVQGMLIVGMSVLTADRLASQITQQQIVTFDQVAAQTVAELSNRIADHAIIALEDQGYTCDATPPTVIRGKNVKMDTMGVATLKLPFDLGEHGEVTIALSLGERLGGMLKAP